MVNYRNSMPKKEFQNTKMKKVNRKGVNKKEEAQD
jgi:hypothetical protein